ncbi:LOW QUALITY PROTEIN: RNA-binding protein 45-like [Sceloporus undulatus]|uniref:LOW QUALITY PROTEIN: RNA-binding protein 45-like n=1 Tax=Sceloporus undulatus TaxID=8520 RepID=UPI001C4BCA49|nr:LOW QUALITY PROTEIN: RNA-binding protein 45-like [Sceloporus undulatus]
MAALPVQALKAAAAPAEERDPRSDHPRYSRLLASLGTAASPEEIRQRFAPFGEVADVWVMRDRPCGGEALGAAYVKYALASQACRAAEELEGRRFSPEAPRPMKVCIAQRQTTGGTKNIGIRQLTLIHVHVPDSFTEKHLTDTFKIYGTIDVCMILQKENEEVAYIRFLKASQAALAIEECDKRFKAVWADGETTLPEIYEEKKESSEVQRSSLSSLVSGYSTTGPDLVNKLPEYHEHEYSKGSMDYRTPLPESVTKQNESSLQYSYVNNTEQEAQCYRTEQSSIYTSDKSTKSSECIVMGEETSYHKIRERNLLASAQPPNLASVERRDTKSPESVSRRLLVVSEFPFSRQQLFNLCNLIPGLESCEVSQGLYSNHAYAVVQYNNAASAIYAKHKLNGFEYPFGSWLLVTFIEGGTGKTDLLRRTAKRKPSSFQLLESSETQSSSPYLQTDAGLPSSKRKAPLDSYVRERLFIMFSPHPLPQDILDNVLCRFGNFINVYLIPGENIAYAMFAERASASDAIAVLHGKTVNGVKLKVKLADLPIEDSSKRQRTF